MADVKDRSQRISGQSQSVNRVPDRRSFEFSIDRARKYHSLSNFSLSRFQASACKLTNRPPCLRFCPGAAGGYVATSAPSVCIAEDRTDTETEVPCRIPNERAAATSLSSCTIFRIYCSQTVPAVSCRRSCRPLVSSIRRMAVPVPGSSKLERANRCSPRSLCSRSRHLQSGKEKNELQICPGISRHVSAAL